MKSALAIFGGVVIFACLLIGLIVGGPLVQLKLSQYFSPAFEQVRYDVQKNSQTYNDGMIRDIDNAYIQYQTATPEGKQALRAVILHKLSMYDTARLPVHLQNFYHSLSAEK
jgi:hypothetical protein